METKVNCLIFGSGRSGTSMLGGILHQAGYYMGDKLHKPEPSNPKGFFEWMTINQINEKILDAYGRRNLTAKFFEVFFKKSTVYNPAGRNQKWLISLPVSIDVTRPVPELESEIKDVTNREPYCYKDPRFSYTLPVWKKFLKPDTVLLCVFRAPDVTVNSILKECGSRDYLKSLYINRSMAYGVWLHMYSHILVKHVPMFKNLVFVHYNQIYSGEVLPMLSEKLNVPLQNNFVEQDLKRTEPYGEVPPEVKSLYKRLCAMAHYAEE